MLEQLLQNPTVQRVRAIAQGRGIPVMLVGGAVRDALLGKPANDFDFAVQGNAAIALARATADALDADFWLMDAAHGTARVIRRAATNTVLDFAQCRGNTWHADLLARDFGINAMGLDLQTQSFIDPANGQADLQAGVVRMVTPQALDDDPVRALRAVRFAQRLGFSIEPQTLAKVKATGSAIHRASAERSRDELLAMLALPRAAAALRQLDEVGLLAELVPEVEPMRVCTQSPPQRSDVLEHTLQVIEGLDSLVTEQRIGDWGLEPVEPISSLRSHLLQETANASRGAVLKLAGLLHDCGKPVTRSVDAAGHISFPGHAQRGAEMAGARARALKLSGDEVRDVRTLVLYHGSINALARAHATTPPTPRQIFGFMRDAGNYAPELALFGIADCFGKRGAATQPSDCEPSWRMAAQLCAAYFAHYAPPVAPAPLITGRDLLALGVAAGPRIGALLEQVRAAQMTGEIATRDEALGLVSALLR